MQTVTDAKGLDAALAGKKAVVLFHSTWCPFCVSFKPTFVSGTKDANGYTPVECIIDEEENPLWDTYSIDIVPTVIFFDGGKIVKRLDGKAGKGLSAKELAGALR